MSLAERHVASVRHAVVNCVVRLLDSSEIINHMSFGMRKIYFLCNLHFYYVQFDVKHNYYILCYNIKTTTYSSILSSALVCVSLSTWHVVAMKTDS